MCVISTMAVFKCFDWLSYAYITLMYIFVFLYN